MVQSIIKELILRSDDCEEIIETIYFGGGTPSIMSVDEIDQILTKITENYTVSDHVEITLETNSLQNFSGHSFFLEVVPWKKITFFPSLFFLSNP